MINPSSVAPRDKTEALSFCFHPLLGRGATRRAETKGLLLSRRCFVLVRRGRTRKTAAYEGGRKLADILGGIAQGLRSRLTGIKSSHQHKTPSRCRLPIDKTTHPVRVAIEKTDCLPNQPGKVSSVFVSDWNREGDQVDTSAFLTDSQPYGNSRHLETNKECWERIESMCLSTLGNLWRNYARV